MDLDLALLRAEVANSRPLGARLDSAKAKFATAESKVQSAEGQLTNAIQHLEEAREQQKAAEETLAELRSEIPKEGAGLSGELVR